MIEILEGGTRKKIYECVDNSLEVFQWLTLGTIRVEVVIVKVKELI